MAMFSTLSLLLSLLFVSCSIDNICSCTSTAVQMPSTVNARAAVIQYWKLKLGTNKAPPRILLSKLSTLSPCQLNSMNLHNIREMIIDEAKEEEAAAAAANSGDAESSNHIEMVTSEEKAEEEVGRNSHASVQYAPSSIENKYSHASAAISNGDFSDKDTIVASEKNTKNDNHAIAIYSSNGSYVVIYDGDDKIVTSEKNKNDDHATAIYNSNGSYVTAIYNSNGSYVTAIYDDDFSYNSKIVANKKYTKNDNHTSAIYGSNSSYVTAIYDGDFSIKGEMVASEKNRKNNDHASAIYGSNGTYVTAIYDSEFSDNGKIVTGKQNTKSNNHGAVIYSSNGTYVTAIYDGEFSDNGKIVTGKHNTKSNNHGAAIYSSNGSYVTAIYDGAYSNNYKIVTSEKNKNDDHATVIYNSNGTYVTAIYDGEFSDNGTVTIERNKEKQAANTYNSKDNHVGVAHHTHESNDIDNTFFRESNLNKGKVMPMPHFKDKMPLYHFLPKSIAARIPFSVTAIRDIFQIPANTTMGKAVEQNVAACKMPPNKDEMKQCMSAAEDMIDFVTFGLGSNNIVVKSMENSNGSGSRVLIGDAKVVNMNNGEFTRTLICHQEDFPYMLHHCHTVPKTRLYEVEILDAETKQKINSGTAICHIDTSTWGSKHTAFAMLESLPGKTEVCHWILPWEMAWTIAPTA